jgi:hypothetical protein
MIIKRAINQLLETDAALAAIVSTKIYANRAPQKTDPPYVIFGVQSGPRLQTIDGPTGLATPSLLVDIYAPNEDQVAQIAEIIRLRIGAFKGVVTDNKNVPAQWEVKIRFCRIDNEEDLPPELQDPLSSSTRQTYFLMHDEAV